MAMKGIFSVLTVLAVGSAFALTPQEVQKLVNDNNRTANGLMRKITDTCSGTPRESPSKIGKAKDFAALKGVADELDKLVALKEGAPTVCTAAKVRLLMAEAYSRPLNLRFTKEARAEFAKAKALAKDPDEKALIAFESAKFEYDAAEDDQPEKWEAEMKAAYATPGLTPRGKIELLKRGIPGLEFEKDGWEAVKGCADVKVKQAYFERLLWHTSWQTQSHGLDPTNTPEYWLSVCDRAIKELGEKDAAGFVSRRRGFLRALGRGDEVEKELLAQLLGEKDVRRQISAYAALGEHYEAMAKRYYADPDAGLMKKAITAYRAALDLDPKNGGYRRTLAEAMMRAKDYKGVKELLEPHVDLANPDPWTVPLLGDCYYYLGDWEGAIRCYEPFGDKLNAGDRIPPNRWDRKANALYALGRYEECLKTVDKLADWLVWKDRKAAYRQRLKKLIGEKVGE